MPSSNNRKGYELVMAEEPLLHDFAQVKETSEDKMERCTGNDGIWKDGGLLSNSNKAWCSSRHGKVKTLLIALLVFASIWIVSKVYGNSWNSKETLSSAPENFVKGKDASTSLAKVHYMMPSTKSNWMFCNSLASALVHDAEPIILDWNNNQTYYEIYMAKITLMTEYLNKYPNEDDIVILVDAFDNTLQRPISEVAARFRKQRGTRILFGAEKNCCCMGESPEYRFCTDVPDSPLPKDVYGRDTDQIVSDRENGNWEHVRPRWLNSGTVIGYAGDLKRFYGQVLDFHLNHPIGKTIRDDQSIFQHLFYKNQDQVKLDYLGELIKPMWASDEEVIFAPKIEFLEANTISVGEENSRNSDLLLRGATPKHLYNVVTKRWSAFLHWNGPAKEMQKTTLNNFWWSGAGGETVQLRVNAFLKNQSVRLDHKNGKKMTWTELCGTHLALKPSGFKIIS